MKKALVLGGTRFFGVHLVESLIDKGFEVTVATRGNAAQTFSKPVHNVVVDRRDKENLQDVFKGANWELVYDQICYTPEDARLAIDVFTGKTKKYVFTSTKSVYDNLGPQDIYVEEDFNPYNYSFRIGGDELPYGEGKRQAEAVFFQEAPFKVAAVRIPIVMGPDDYTGRLDFHIKKVLAGEEIYFPDIKAEMDYILSKEAGSFIAWAGTGFGTGPVNAGSDGTVSMGEILALIEESTGKKAILAKEASEENHSPYGVPSSWIMSNKKARDNGFVFSNIQEWLPELINQSAEKLKASE